MGSGSTGVACKNTNRNFTGIEMNEEYFKIAEQRIKDQTTCLSKLIYFFKQTYTPYPKGYFNQ